VSTGVYKEDLMPVEDGEMPLSQIGECLINNAVIPQDWEIKDEPFYLYNKAQEVETDDKINEVFKPNETIIIFIGDICPTKGLGSIINWKGLKSISNDSGVKVVIVMETKLGKMIPFTEEKWDSIDFRNYKAIVEICWEPKPSDHKQTYKCWQYKFDEDNVKYKIMDVAIGIHKYPEEKVPNSDPTPILLAPLKQVQDKCAMDFRIDTVFAFKNTGKH